MPPDQPEPQKTFSQKTLSLCYRLKAKVKEGRRLVQDELWDRDMRPLPRLQTAAITLARIVGIVIRGFIHDKCYMQAGTLTYLTLMSLVPILALMFSVSKGLGAQEMLMENIGLQRNPALEERNNQDLPAREQDEEDISILHDINGEEIEDGPLRDFVIMEESRLAEMPEQFGQIAITIFSAVERTNVRTLGVIGLVILIWTVIRVMGKVENSFNSIWGVQKPRPLTRRFSDYISILVVVPILVLCATSINAFLSSDRALEMVRERFGELSLIYEFAIRWTMYGAIILAFMFLLMFMPNTKVRFLPALIGGFVTGLAWFAAQEIYFFAQGGVTRYNAIYGTFAILPFFLAWLHTSWLIVLFGAELSFGIQNHRAYRLEQSGERATPATLTLLGMMIMFETGKRHLEGNQPWSTETFAEEHGIPSRLISRVVYTLLQQGLLQQLADSAESYVPARDISKITFADIEMAFRGKVDPRITSLLEHTAPEIRKAESQYRSRFQEILNEKNLRELIEQENETRSDTSVVIAN